MPVHRVPKSTIHEDVADIHRQGEHIVAVAVDGEDFVVFTEYAGSTPPRSYETRVETVRAGWHA